MLRRKLPMLASQLERREFLLLTGAMGAAACGPMMSTEPDAETLDGTSSADASVDSATDTTADRADVLADSTPDAFRDAANAETASDAMREAAVDSAVDAGSDASMDAMTDSAPEVFPDTSSPDVLPDVGADASIDTATDVVLEAGPEPIPEAGPEPIGAEPTPDAGLDASADAPAEAGPEPIPEAGPDAPQDTRPAGPACPPGATRVGAASSFTIGNPVFVLAGRFFVVRDSEGLYAVTAVCTHAGCIVNAGGPGFSCPCHGSGFTTNGAVANGPAASPLVHFQVCRFSDGTLGVDTTTIVAANVRLAV